MKQLLQSILEVRKATGEVLKKGHNDFHHYSYATANDVITEVRDAMNEKGIVVFPKEMRDFTYFKDGQVEQYTQIFSVFHAESGEQMDVSIRCAGEDKGDKKAYKSNTGALKYLLIQLFLLPTGDDPEAAAGQGSAATTQKQPVQQQAAQQMSRQMAQPQQQAKPEAEKKWLNKATAEWRQAAKYLGGGGDLARVLATFKVNKYDMDFLMQDADFFRNEAQQKKEEQNAQAAG